MSGQVALVTDSTSYLPTGVAAAHRITVVPLQVVVGGTSHEEGTEISPAQVAEALRSYVPVSTSRPSADAFRRAYDAAAEAGATEVVSVHLSADMSGTVDSASLGARDARVPVHVVDSRSLGMGTGYALVAAAEAISRGASAAEAAGIAEKRATATSVLFYVDTLEHLRRGGRIGHAQALLGGALAVKPLLRLLDGRIRPLEKVRTSSRAISRLEELALEAAGAAPVDVAVHHLANAGRAEALAERLRAHLPDVRDLLVSEVGAVVGAHVGPGMLAVVVAPRAE